jgi:hypothetical protein
MPQQIPSDATPEEIARQARINALPHGPGLNFGQWVGTSSEQPQELTFGPIHFCRHAEGVWILFIQNYSGQTGIVLSDEERIGLIAWLFATQK